MRKGQPFFTLQQLFIRYFRTAKVHKYVMKCAHFPWSQESNITEWRVCSGRPTSCVYLEAYSPLPPPVMVRRHTPALATCQPRDESSETIPLSPSIIHMSDEELGCPGNYRWRIIAQWAKFQGNLKKH